MKTVLPARSCGGGGCRAEFPRCPEKEVARLKARLRSGAPHYFLTSLFVIAPNRSLCDPGKVELMEVDAAMAVVTV